MNHSVLLILDKPLESGFVIESFRNFNEEPHEMYCCPSYEDAFGILFLKKWDLIVIDYHLSRHGGLETFKRIKGIIHYNTCIVFYFNQEPSHEQIKEIKEMGVCDYLVADEVGDPKKIEKVKMWLNHTNKQLSNNSFSINH